MPSPRIRSTSHWCGAASELRSGPAGPSGKGVRAMPSARKRLLPRVEFANAVTCSAAVATPQVPINVCILVWEPQREWTKWKSTGPAERRNKLCCPQWTAFTLLWKEKGSSNGEALFREFIPTWEHCGPRPRRPFCECYSYLWVFDRQSGTISDDQRGGFRNSRKICRRHSASWHQFSTSGLAHIQKIFAGDDGFGCGAF